GFRCRGDRGGAGRPGGGARVSQRGAALRRAGGGWADRRGGAGGGSPRARGGVGCGGGGGAAAGGRKNPRGGLAPRAACGVLRADELRGEKTFVGTREATAEEYADFAAAWPRFEAAAERILRERDDAPMAEVARSLPDDPWAVTVETWEGPIICCVEATEFS